MKSTPLDDFSAHTTNERRILIFMLFLTCSLNFADRAVFSALAQTIKVDLRLTDLELGLLQGLLFALLYAFVGLPIGLLCERFSRKRIIAAATIIWSAATAGTGVATGFTQLALSRLIVGMGEAGFTPATASMVADIVPRNRRASTMSIIILGTPFGNFGGAVLAGYIAASWDWRTAFLAFALPGIFVAVALLLLTKEPRRGTYDTINPSQANAPSVKQFLSTVIANKPLLWVIAGGGLAGFGMTSISQFLAVFLARTFELDIREAAFAFGAVSGISITFGLLVGSFGTDYLARHDARWPAWGAALGLFLAPPLYWMAFNTPSLPMTIAFLLGAGGMLLMFFGPATGMIQNLLPTRMRASGVALYTLLYTLLGSGLGPVFVGGVSDIAASRFYAGDYSVDCPHGLPLADASAAIASACRAASANGLQTALSIAVTIFFAAAFCFMRVAPGLASASKQAQPQTKA